MHKPKAAMIYIPRCRGCGVFSPTSDRTCRKCEQACMLARLNHLRDLRDRRAEAAHHRQTRLDAGLEPLG
jgi:hypothetical protein